MANRSNLMKLNVKAQRRKVNHVSGKTCVAVWGGGFTS